MPISAAPAVAQTALDEAIAALGATIDDRDATITRHLAEQSTVAETVHMLRSAPRIGPVVAITLAALLPDLGRTSGEGIAALVGVAPYARESGQSQGHRQIAGGRAEVRRAHSMAAKVAATRTSGVIAAFYARLKARGKPSKVALTACMRKLIVRLWEVHPS